MHIASVRISGRPASAAALRMRGPTSRSMAAAHRCRTTRRREVCIQYTVGYQPGATAQNSRPVTPFFLDVTRCGNSTYDVPGNGGPGGIHTAARTWSAPWDGYMVTAGGHLHGVASTSRSATTPTGWSARWSPSTTTCTPTMRRRPSPHARPPSRSGRDRPSRSRPATTTPSRVRTSWASCSPTPGAAPSDLGVAVGRTQGGERLETSRGSIVRQVVPDPQLGRSHPITRWGG